MTWLNLLVVVSFLSTAVFGATIPAEWQAKVDSYNAFFGEDDTGALNPETGYPLGLYLPVIGNGYISHAKGVRSDTMFISGVFNGETTSPSHRARIPATFAVTVAQSETTGVLFDIENGVYHRRGSLTGTTAWYELRWYAHRAYPSIYAMELEVHLVDESSVTLTLSNHNGAPSEDIAFSAPVLSADGSSYSTCGSTLIPEVSNGQTTEVCYVADQVPVSFTVTKADCGRTFSFLTSFSTSLELTELDRSVLSVASKNFQMAKSFTASEPHSAGTPTALMTAHTLAWAGLWTSGIEVAGRPDVAMAVNASLYAILSSVRESWPYGLAPGGLTNYYNGHSFWDTETWMYPPMLFLHPSISQELLQYRFNRLDGARKKAASYSPPFAGTMFPWESAFSGVETCPTFAATGLREDHISGDIAFAIWQEWQMRQDRVWLRNIGWPMLEGIADFWVSRSTYLEDGRAHILDIIPPDEYVDHVNDSVYSNWVAIKSLNYAVQASLLLNETCANCATYSKLAQDIVILFDESRGIHPEYADYPGNVVKQADVVLLHYPLNLAMDEEVQRADLEWYSTRTDTHGPAMTWGMHAIGFLDLGDYASAAKYFNMSFQDNTHTPFHVWTETPDGNAVNFITGAGGFLQTMISGYPGVRITENQGLALNPVCGEGMESVKIRSFEYRGAALDFEYHCDSSSASLSSSSAKGGRASQMRVKLVDITAGQKFQPLRMRSVNRKTGKEGMMPKPLAKGAEIVLDLKEWKDEHVFYIF